MRFLATYLILFICFTISTSFHPIHVTVTNINFNSNNKAFDVSIKLFLDDFQNVILKNNSVELNLGKTNELSNADNYILNYIRNNVKFTINNNKLSQKKLKFVRKEIIDGAIWLYFTYQLSGKIETIQVDNNLLNDYYPDMTNLVIMKYNNIENGYTLDKHKTSFKISS